MEGQCKIEFEKYLSKNYGKYVKNLRFYQYPESMQWGVIVDFFDSVGIYIEQNQFIKIDENMFGYDIQEHKGSSIWGVGDIYSSKSRAEARKQAIEKATQIYNQSENKDK